MQGSSTAPACGRATARPCRWAALTLSILLTACHAPQADSAAGAQTTDATVGPPAFAPAPRDHVRVTEQDTPEAIAADAPITDADGNPYRPDDSYNQANLRLAYQKCIDASDAVTFALQACGDEEFRWQQQRLRAAWGTIADGPDSEHKDKLADEQDAYMRDTDRYCRFDPATQGQGQMLDAQSCRINRYANRADALEALTSP